MKCTLAGAVLCVGLSLAGCGFDRAPVPTDIVISEDVILRPIADGVWVHTTYFDVPGAGRYPANGLVIIEASEALLIDLPWTDAQTAVLCDWIAENRGASLKAVVPTHFHVDCMGGLAEAHRRGAASYALDKTVSIARQRGLPVAQNTYAEEVTLRCGRTAVHMGYFGGGHTIDNVVAWLPHKRILFGGCLVKSRASTSLGNTRDGDLDAYPLTLRKLQAAYPDANVVVPGHGDWGGPELIDHTLALCRDRER